MADTRYKLVGTVNVPEEKKDELNTYVLQVLKKCGIRKTEEICLEGKKFTVITMPKVDENGIVSFDYSIFERKKRDISTYNLHTCELVTEDRGYMEYGLAMNLILTLIEVYSTGHCYLADDNKPCSTVSAYARILKDMMGVELRFLNRSNMWDLLLFFKKKVNENITSRDILYNHTLEHAPFVDHQVITILAMTYENLYKTECFTEPFTVDKKNLPNRIETTFAKYIYTVFKKLLEQNKDKELHAYLKELLDADYATRDQMADASDELSKEFSDIAVFSLCVLPAYIVTIYATAREEDFWDVWDSLDITGYSDILLGEKDKIDCKGASGIPFFEAIQRNNQDEFIDCWEEEEMLFSDEMKERLSDWQEQYKQISDSDIAGLDMEKMLADIVNDMTEVWEWRLVDKEFVNEFLEHAEETNYQKAVVLLRNIMEQLISMFPELTREQALEWMIKPHIRTVDKIAMSACQSLLINHKQRKELFGF